MTYPVPVLDFTVQNEQEKNRLVKFLEEFLPQYRISSIITYSHRYEISVWEKLNDDISNA